MVTLYIRKKPGIRPYLENESGVIVTWDMRIINAIQRGTKSGSWSVVPSEALQKEMRRAGMRRPGIDEQIKIAFRSEQPHVPAHTEHSEIMREITGHSGLDW